MSFLLKNTITIYLILFSSWTLFAESARNQDQSVSKEEKNKLKGQEQSKEASGEKKPDSKIENKSPKTDLFDPPEFRSTSNVTQKNVSGLKTKALLQTEDLPKITLKARVLKYDNSAVAILLVDKKEVFVEPNDVFPIVINDFKWDLSVKSITKNGVEIEIKHNSIKLLVK